MFLKKWLHFKCSHSKVKMTTRNQLAFGSKMLALQWVLCVDTLVGLDT